MTELVKYDAACRLIAETIALDPLKDIRDQAMAMRLYAQQAKNKALEANAFEIRMRAERRIGELMELGKSDRVSHGGDRSIQGFSENPCSRPTLAEAGIDKNLANRARKLQTIPQTEFERVISEGRDAIERGVERQVLKAVEIASAREALLYAFDLLEHDGEDLRLQGGRRHRSSYTDHRMPWFRPRCRQSSLRPHRRC